MNGVPNNVVSMTTSIVKNVQNLAEFVPKNAAKSQPSSFIDIWIGFLSGRVF